MLDDLLEDSAAPDFQAGLMDKTLRSARRRRRMRHFSSALGIMALLGICAIMFRDVRHQTISSNQIRPETLTGATSQSSLNHPRVVSTKPDSALAIVQTSEGDRPKEINDKELVTLLSNEPVALVRYASGRAELISLSQNN